MKNWKEKYPSFTECFPLIAQIYDRILKMEDHKAFAISFNQINSQITFGMQCIHILDIFSNARSSYAILMKVYRIYQTLLAFILKPEKFT